MATEKRLIDANALIGKSIAVQAPRTSLTLLPGQQWMDTVHAVRITDIMSEPTVDAVEVVRCKDCRYCQHDSNGFWCFNDYEHNLQPDDFCSYGERKDDA